MCVRVCVCLAGHSDRRLGMLGRCAHMSSKLAEWACVSVCVCVCVSACVCELVCVRV